MIRNQQFRAAPGIIHHLYVRSEQAFRVLLPSRVGVTVQTRTNATTNTRSARSLHPAPVPSARRSRRTAFRPLGAPAASPVTASPPTPAILPRLAVPVTLRLRLPVPRHNWRTGRLLGGLNCLWVSTKSSPPAGPRPDSRVAALSTSPRPGEPTMASPRPPDAALGSPLLPTAGTHRRSPVASGRTRTATVATLPSRASQSSSSASRTPSREGPVP